jgi:hypothetical protein
MWLKRFRFRTPSALQNKEKAEEQDSPNMFRYQPFSVIITAHP